MKDHREIGRDLEIFFTDDIAPGAPFWLPNGMIIFKQLEKNIRKLTSNAGYLETSTPIMVKTDLFRQSGHWDKFGEGGGGNDMYNLSLYDDNEISYMENYINEKKKEIKKISAQKKEKSFWYDAKISDSQTASVLLEELPSGEYRYSLPVNFTLKPMNCPESTIIYRHKLRSYRDLPLRLSEIGRLHRREQSGEINGLLRVRQMTMDDAHIYCSHDQIFDEISTILDMQKEFYENLGFSVEFKLATRPKQRAGTDKMWDEAEKDLEKVLKQKKVKYSQKDRDGAFYGPKIDVQINDSLGREWQLATTQLDFHMPEAFKLTYTGKDGKEEKPAMIHRAILGSFERFVGILLEHLQGNLPVWLSPVQSVVLPISDKHITYAKKIAKSLKEDGIRVEVDERNETLQAKIRDATIQKTPYLLIVGEKEESSDSVAVRTRSGEDLGKLKIDEFKKKLQIDIDKKS